MTFDLRQTAGHVTELKVPNRNVPLTSLAYVPLCRTSCLKLVTPTSPLIIIIIKLTIVAFFIIL